MRRAALLAMVLSACVAESPPAPRAERVVVVVLDTVRADVLEGAAEGGLPAIAALLDEGIHFPRAWAAASYTLPSHAAMLTGRDAAEHRLTGERPQLAETIPTLAERFRDGGYRTAGFHEGGYLRLAYGFDRGFGTWRELARRSLVGDAQRIVLDWISANADQPFLLFIHTYAAHDPYGGWEALRNERPELSLPTARAIREIADQYPDAQPAERIPDAHRHLFHFFNPLADKGVQRVRDVPMRPVEALREGPWFDVAVEAMREGYARRVERADSLVGALRERLEAEELWDDTLFVVTSDHGEAFFEHDQPWHGYVPYEEVLRVPWIVSWPRALAQRRTRAVDAPVWHLDLVPTLLAAAKLPSAPELPGRDLLAADSLAQDHPVFPLVAEVEYLAYEPRIRVAIADGWKLVPDSPRFHAEGVQLFELASDPREERNRADEAPDRRIRLAEATRAYEAGLHEAPVERGRAKLDPTTAESLRALGYIDP